MREHKETEKGKNVEGSDGKGKRSQTKFDQRAANHFPKPPIGKCFLSRPIGSYIFETSASRLVQLYMYKV